MYSRIEECLLGLVALDHRVVVTARLQDEDSRGSPRRGHDQPRPSINGLAKKAGGYAGALSPLFRTMELLPLEMDCRKSLVEALFCHEVGNNVSDDVDAAADFVEDFIDNLDEDEEHKWSTPMMVSMLVASWNEKKRQGQDKNKESLAGGTPKRKTSLAGVPKAPSKTSPDSTGIPSEHVGSASDRGGLAVDIREVYKVALDLLLRRFQSRQQADRHKMKATVQKFKELLQLIAVKMTDEGKKEFTEHDVIPLLREHNMAREVWTDLADAIRGGRVPLLQARWEEGDGHTDRYIFAYGSFRDFLTRESFRGNVRRLVSSKDKAQTPHEQDSSARGASSKDSSARGVSAPSPSAGSGLAESPARSPAGLPEQADEDGEPMTARSSGAMSYEVCGMATDVMGKQPSFARPLKLPVAERQAAPAAPGAVTMWDVFTDLYQAHKARQVLAR